MTGILIKEETWTQRQTCAKGRPYENIRRAPSTSQGKPETTGTRDKAWNK